MSDCDRRCGRRRGRGRGRGKSAVTITEVDDDADTDVDDEGTCVCVRAHVMSDGKSSLVEEAATIVVHLLFSEDTVRAKNLASLRAQAGALATVKAYVREHTRGSTTGVTLNLCVLWTVYGAAFRAAGGGFYDSPPPVDPAVVRYYSLYLVATWCRVEELTSACELRGAPRRRRKRGDLTFHSCCIVLMYGLSRGLHLFPFSGTESEPRSLPMQHAHSYLVPRLPPETHIEHFGVLVRTYNDIVHQFNDYVRRFGSRLFP